ncbi:MAG: cysteine--tRNA ligase [Rickettsiales bacterium]|nr:cysteine--tRNA ligase [Rickettsiales bacterium]
MLKLYNTLDEKVGEFQPIDKNNVRMYVCGPTVYNRVHLGNARSVMVFDILFRVLRHIYSANCVKYVRNITDVDDKIINAAQQQGVSDVELSTKMTDFFHEDCSYLNCLQPTVEPRVTQEIPEIIATIRKIIDNGHAYIADGNVMFSVESYKDYGMLSHRKIETNIKNERVEGRNYKRNQDDFLLWKRTEVGVTWDSPWGKGRPGWHIECSAMSNKYLGTDFDIHGGGADLKFPHHENEIAQSCCANQNSSFALHWMHNGFLMINGQKMSKSLGNFVTIADMKNRGVNGNALRLALLSTHYRKPMNFSDKLVQDSEKMLRKFYKVKEQIGDNNSPTLSDVDLEPMYQDLNTTKFIANINKAYSEKNFALVLKMLEFIGILL